MIPTISQTNYENAYILFRFFLFVGRFPVAGIATHSLYRRNLIIFLLLPPKKKQKKSTKIKLYDIIKHLMFNH